MSSVPLKRLKFLTYLDSDTNLNKNNTTCRDVISTNNNTNGNVNKYSWQTLATCSQQEARKCISFAIAKEHCVLPLSIISKINHSSKDSDVLVLAVSKAPDANLIKLLRFASQMDIICDVIDESTVKKALYAAYNGSLDKCVSSLVAANEDLANQNKHHIHSSDGNSELDIKATKAPVPELLNSILDRALFRNATDVHIEPRFFIDNNQYVIRFRIDGILQHDSVFDMQFDVAHTLFRRIRVLCKLDISQHERPQEGSFSYKRESWNTRVRVSILPLVKGYKVELRLLDNSFLEESLSSKQNFDNTHTQCNDFSNTLNADMFCALGLDSSQIAMLDSFLAQSSGVVLAVGPTGSGKSTLLYAALSRCNDGTKSILTIEDPVERIISGVNQVAVKNVSGMSHADLLKTSLRQDPDIIMIGEIRDKETAQVALTAGVTGHLVLSTLHSGFCIEAFDRLIHLGINHGLIASSLKLIIAQRLLPKNCNICKKIFPESDKVARLLNLKTTNIDPNFSFMFSTGCDACHKTGIAGRVGVFEFMPVHEGLRAMLIAQSIGKAEYLNIRQQEHSKSIFNFGRRVCDLMVSGVVSPIFALQALGMSTRYLRV